MIKEILLRLGLSVAIIILIYLVSSYMIMSFNPNDLAVADRFMQIFIAVIIIGFIVGWPDRFLKDN